MWETVRVAFFLSFFKKKEKKLPSRIDYIDFFFFFGSHCDSNQPTLISWFFSQTNIMVGFETPLDVLHEFRTRMRQYVNDNPREWKGGSVGLSIPCLAFYCL